MGLKGDLGRLRWDSRRLRQGETGFGHSVGADVDFQGRRVHGSVSGLGVCYEPAKL